MADTTFRDRIKGTITYGILKDLYDAVTLPGDVYAGRVDPTSDEAIKRAFDLAGTLTLGAGAVPAAGNELRMGIKAYHGSPHDFEKFSSEKIGTGEGAQAYGHGLYFAENEDVAQGYKYATAAKNREVTFDGKRLSNSQDWWGIQDKLEAEDWRLRKAFDSLQSNMSQGYNTEEAIRFSKDWYRNQPDMVEAVDQVAKRMEIKIPPPRMYEVDINAKPEQFLDWDKPLSEQPAGRKLIDEFEKRRNEILDNIPEIDSSISYSDYNKKYGAQLDEAARLHIDPNWTGAQLYESSGLVPGPYRDKKAAAQTLAETNVPGIRYLDQGSRGSGKGTYNYVVFDDSLISILKKYGVVGPVLAALGVSQAIPSDAEAAQRPQGGGGW